MKLRSLLLAALATAMIPAGAGSLLLRSGTGEKQEARGKFSNAAYATTLAQYVDDRGMVNYRGLAADRARRDAFVGSFEHAEPDSWAAPEKIAFWINAYNALTLEAVAQNYPIQSSMLRSGVYPKNSIRQIPGVWDKLQFRIAGKEMTLDDIEHRTLRAQFNEPRIHVALVCAALSCPPLRKEPYTGEKLDGQLDDQARRFFASARGFRIDRAEKKVYLSSIFKWFGGDFVKTYRTMEEFAGRSESERAVLNFVSRYVSKADRDYLIVGAYDVKYLDYDWTLNEQPAR